MSTRNKFYLVMAVLSIWATACKDAVGPVDNDVCPNISGTQLTVPTGMVKNASGDCVANVIQPKKFEASIVTPNETVNQSGWETNVSFTAQTLMDGSPVSTNVSWKVDGVDLGVITTKSFHPGTSHTVVLSATNPQTGEVVTVTKSFSITQAKPITVHIWMLDGSLCKGWWFHAVKDGMPADSVRIPDSSTLECAPFQYYGQYAHLDTVQVSARNFDGRHLWQLKTMVNLTRLPNYGGTRLSVNDNYGAQEVRFIAADTSFDPDWAYTMVQGSDGGYLSFFPKDPGSIGYDNGFVWPAGQRIPVAIDQASSITTIDPAVVSQALQELESELKQKTGKSYSFTLVPLSDLPVVNGVRRGVVIKLTGQSPNGQSGQYVVNYDVVAGTIDLPWYFNSQYGPDSWKTVIKHEMVHVLGYGHDIDGVMGPQMYQVKYLTPKESVHVGFYSNIKDMARILGVTTPIASNVQGYLAMHGRGPEKVTPWFEN